MGRARAFFSARPKLIYIYHAFIYTIMGAFSNVIISSNVEFKITSYYQITTKNVSSDDNTNFARVFFN